MSENKVTIKYINIKDNDLGILNTKEASLYLKKKYIGKWECNKYHKPVNKELFFNVSHSHDIVAIGIADVDIGIDIEKIREVDDKLKRYVSSDEEFNTINTNEDFFKVWTAKESLVKAQGTGIDRRPENIPALPFDGIKEYNKIIYRSKQVKLDGYILAITIRSDEDFDLEVERE